jgi:hypothetical protein
MCVAVLLAVGIMLYAPSALASSAWLLAPLLFVTFALGFLGTMIRVLCSGNGR